MELMNNFSAGKVRFSRLVIIDGFNHHFGVPGYCFYCCVMVKRLLIQDVLLKVAYNVMIPHGSVKILDFYYELGVKSREVNKLGEK